MKNYERPVVLINEELAEGVYAASGSAVPGANCWTPKVYKANEGQDYVGGYNLFRVYAIHGGVKHISGATTVTITFNYPVTGAYSENTEWICSYSGNVVTITRPSHGNAYNDGDNFDYGIGVAAADEATTRGLVPQSITIQCQYASNVQGEGGDGT